MADEKTVLQYKGSSPDAQGQHDLLRLHGRLAHCHAADSETKKVQDTDIATRVSVELQLTDPNARAKDRIVKKSEKTASSPRSIWEAYG